MFDDRHVTYIAYAAEEPHCAARAAMLRVRTYGGHIPPMLDIQYRRNVCSQVEANGGEVGEVVVTDAPFVEGLHYEPVNGFLDLRDGAPSWRNAAWDVEAGRPARSHDAAPAPA